MIRLIIDIYILIIIADVILSYLPQYKFTPWAVWIRKLANYTLKPVQKLIPPSLGLPIDPSPIIVIIALNLLTAIW